MHINFIIARQYTTNVIIRNHQFIESYTVCPDNKSDLYLSILHSHLVGKVNLWCCSSGNVEYACARRSRKKARVCVYICYTSVCAYACMQCLCMAWMYRKCTHSHVIGAGTSGSVPAGSHEYYLPGILHTGETSKYLLLTGKVSTKKICIQSLSYQLLWRMRIFSISMIPPKFCIHVLQNKVFIKNATKITIYCKGED